ncbi:MAG: VCBS repeat-containing protein [Deltaproteobacteria bacterium]|nr:VCBS repeat-containing protein [Deltaproteobacteria bacterium]
MSPRYAAALLGIVGCTPRLIEVAEGSGDSGSSSAAATVADGDGPGAVTEDPRPSTDGGVVTTGLETGVDDGPPPPAEECWQTQPMFEAPSNAGVLVADQDFDGREELWVVFDSDGGQGPGETTVFIIDDSGAPIGDLVLQGFVLTLGDIEGDGLRDVVHLAFGGGGPPDFVYASATGLAMFDLPPNPFDLQFSPNNTGFFDITEDGPADMLTVVDGDQLILFAGDGMGSFFENGSVQVDGLGFISAQPVADAPNQALLSSAPNFGGGNQGCLEREYRLIEVIEGQPFVVAEPAPAGEVAHGLAVDVRAFDRGASTVAYVRSCQPGSQTHDVRVLSRTNGEQFVEFPGVTAAPWATVGDFDGDGLVDIGSQAADEPSVTIAWGTDPVTFAPPESISVAVDAISGRNVQAADLDGDGRDELLVGTVIRPGEPAQLRYDRIFLGPC